MVNCLTSKKNVFSDLFPVAKVIYDQICNHILGLRSTGLLINFSNWKTNHCKICNRFATKLCFHRLAAANFATNLRRNVILQPFLRGRCKFEKKFKNIILNRFYSARVGAAGGSEGPAPVPSPQRTSASSSTVPAPPAHAASTPCSTAAPPSRSSL